MSLNPTPGSLSTALKISTYKRRLLLAGLDSRHRSVQSQQQGATAIRALELFQQMQLSSPPVRYVTKQSEERDRAQAMRVAKHT